MILPLPSRLTIEQIRTLFHRNMPWEKGLEAERETYRIALDALKPDIQVFDFGRIGSVEVDKKLAGDLWSQKVLRLPFPNCIFTFSPHDVRITLLLIGDSTIEIGGEPDVKDATAMFVISQPGGFPRLDSFTWFDCPDGDHIKAGASQLSECKGETDESFRSYSLACVGKVLWLSMLLNTKGIPKRHEPIPVKLNQKRARSGKHPLDAVTYVDLSQVSFGSDHKGTDNEKSMHFRRGHIRHYDDGSTTWVRNTIVKAEGQLKERARYQVRP